jgi:hypothetical protein
VLLRRLFAEPGALEQVCGLAGNWITQHLVSRPSGPSPHGDVEHVDPLPLPATQTSLAGESELF